MSEAKAAHTAPPTLLRPDWQVSSRVTAFSTTRLGGVSQPPFDALNLGLHVGDNAEHVMENRQLLQESFALPSKPHWLNQTHSTHVERMDITAAAGRNSHSRIASQPYPDGGVPPTADGAWTNQPDTVLTVLTADCLPVLISNKEGDAVAAIHAGWRGLAGGILENALAMFDQQSDLHAWLGPAIGAEAFEVGEDVLQAFTKRNPSHSAAFTQGQAPGKYWCDLYALARAELRQSRSLVVTGGEHCTHGQPQWFHSHRRDGIRSGRMATLIWVSPES